MRREVRGIGNVPPLTELQALGCLFLCTAAIFIALGIVLAGVFL